MDVSLAQSRRSLGPDDLSRDLGDKPQQIILKDFPVRSGRKFLGKKYYEILSWIEYSCQMDSVYCYVCRHFPQAKTDVAFTETGFNNWAHCERLERHANTDSHKISMVAWEDWKKSQNSGGIAKLLLEGHSKFMEENRHYIGCVASIVQLLANPSMPGI